MRLFKFISGVALCTALIFAVVFLGNYIYEQMKYPVKYEDLVDKYSEQYQVDKILILSVINCESSFNPKAESKIGARGLMQMTENTFGWIKEKINDRRDITFDDIYTPDYSIEYGTALLSILLKQYDDLDTVLCAYHAGMGTVSNWLSDKENSRNGKTLDSIPASSTQTRQYVVDVNKAIKIYTRRFEK